MLSLLQEIRQIEAIKIPFSNLKFITFLICILLFLNLGRRIFSWCNIHICWEIEVNSGILFYFVKVTSNFTAFLWVTSSAPQITKIISFCQQKSVLLVCFVISNCALLKLNERIKFENYVILQ